MATFKKNPKSLHCIINVVVGGLSVIWARYLHLISILFQDKSIRKIDGGGGIKVNAGQKWPLIFVGIGNIYFAIYIIKKNKSNVHIRTD